MNLSGSVKINKCGILIISLTVTVFFYYVLFSGGGTRTQKHYSFLLRNPNEISLRKLLIASIQATKVGGLEVVAASNDIQAKSKGKTKEGANDPVTNADLRSHCAMEYGLKRLFPNINLISEEDTVNKHCSDVSSFELDPMVLDEDVQLSDEHVVPIDDVTIWIDPLDATQEYTESLFEYVTTMVCVAVKGEPVIGVIHNPFTKHTVWAWKGEAVSDTIRQIHQTQRNRMEAVKNPKIIVSRSHSGDVKQFVRLAFSDSTPVITAGGAGYKVLQVVNGNATAYIHQTRIKKWDICAGNAILEALHGQMTTLKQEPISYAYTDSVVNDRGVLATLHDYKYHANKIHDYQQQLEFLKPT